MNENNRDLVYIKILKDELKKMTIERDELKKQLEDYKKKKRFWSFTFYIRNIFK